MRRRRESAISIVFETSAVSTDDERWVASGWSDSRLSNVGRRQAKELRDRRMDDELAAVFTSDLGRAVETVQIAFAGRGVGIFHDWRLRGCDYGASTGSPSAEIEAARVQHVYEPYPGGESYADVVVRTRRFLQDLPPRLADARIVVVGHSATKWALDHVLEGTPLQELVETSFRWQPGWHYRVRVDR